MGRVCSVEHDEVSCFWQILELLGSSSFERSAHDKKSNVENVVDPGTIPQNVRIRVNAHL